MAEAEDAAAHRTATAMRITDAPPQLDGVLDDEIWKNAPLHEGFRQRDPDEAEPETERPTFQIAYDDEVLYFAIMCYDSEPEKIVSRLVRRDTDIESDRVTVIVSVPTVSVEREPGLPPAIFTKQRRSPLGVPAWKHAVFGLVSIARSCLEIS